MSDTMQSESVTKLAAALLLAQHALPAVKKDSVNPHFKSKYADLASCWEAWKAVGPKHGLALAFQFRPDHQGIHLVAKLIHAPSGEWIASELFMPVTKQDAQGYASASTYARRYALCALVGITPDDDDGNEASKAPTAAPPAKDASSPKAVIDASDQRALLSNIAVETAEAQRKGNKAAMRRIAASVKQAEAENLLTGECLELAKAEVRAAWTVVFGDESEGKAA